VRTAYRELESTHQALHDATTENERARARLEHVNAMLKTVRQNFQRLIAREKDRGELLRGACSALVETESCQGAWIGVFDDARTFSETAAAGTCEAAGPPTPLLAEGKVSDEIASETPMLPTS